MRVPLLGAEVRRRAGDVMPYTLWLVSSKERVRRGPLFNKTARFTPSVVTDTETTEIGGGLIDVTLCDGFLAFSTARRCSPNLSLRRRLVSPMYLNSPISVVSL